MRERAGSAEERLERLLRLQELTTSLASQIGPAQELHPVLSAVISAMRSVVDFQGGTIQLVEDGALFVAASDPPCSPEVMSARLPIGSGLGGRVVISGEPIYSPDIGADDRVDPELRRLGSNANMTSYLAVPLVCLGEVIGLMQVDSRQRDAFDEDDLQILQGLSVQVAGAIESARRTEAVRELELLKNEFLANVSHQLRTPLTIISGFVSTLRTYQGRIDPRQQEQMLNRIGSAADRLQYLIEEVLTVTQLQAGTVAPHMSPTRIAPLLDEIRDQSPEPSLVKLECSPDLQVTTDGQMLRLALSHLVDNAVRYADDCEVTAGIGTDGTPFVEVRDQGPGLPSGMAEKMFEPFARGEHSEIGLGLGLSLVRTVAGALGARIEVEQPGGVGLLIRLWLPG